MTDLREVQHPIHPIFQAQGPDERCIIDDVELGWDSCSAYGCAHLIDGVTAHLRQPTGCAVRRHVLPKDITGGLTLNQVCDVAWRVYGVSMDVHVGSNVVRPTFIARQVRAGRRALIQGDAGAFVGTRWQSTAGSVAHLIEINEVRGGTLDNPAEALVYDSAADGRKRAYHVDQGPSWIPWWLVKRFMASLRPAGPGTPKIGASWCYAAFGPDTEPHVKLRAGARRSKPFPDRARPRADRTKVHSQPTIGSKVLYLLAEGELIRGYQVALGDTFRGSKEWLGNDDGTEWVHSKRLNHYAGAT